MNAIHAVLTFQAIQNFFFLFCGTVSHTLTKISYHAKDVGSPEETMSTDMGKQLKTTANKWTSLLKHQASPKNSAPVKISELRFINTDPGPARHVKICIT